MAKELQEVDKTTLCVFRRTIFGLKFFSKVLSRFGFSSENLACFSNFYLRVQRKNSGRNNFFVLLFRFFSEFERNFFFRFLAKKLQEVVKTNFCVCRRTIFGLGIFFKCFQPFWIFCRNLWHGYQNSIYVSRVKIAEEMVFLFFFSEFFSEFERKTFRLSAKKLQEVVKFTFRVCGWTNFGLGIFLKCFEPFWIFCRNLWHGSQNSIYVSRVKIAEEMVFFVFLFRIFFGVSAKDFQTFGQKTSRGCQIYLPRVRMNKFWLGNFFKMFWTVLDFLQKPLAWFSKFYLRVQSKNCGRNGFFVFLFRFFFEFWAKIFQTFGQKTSRSWQNYPLRVQTNNFWLEIFSKVLSSFGFSSENLAWFSKFYIRVQRNNSGKNNFFYSSFQIFFGVWAKDFQTFGQKTSRSCQNYLPRMRMNKFWLGNFF